MTVARLYRMTAADGQEDALAAALAGLAAVVAELPGCGGVELLRDSARPGSFVFIEKWASIDAHKAAGALLPKDALVPLGPAMAGPPEGAYLDYLITD